ncbi:hypothetical protein V5O48_013729, partial [Marasmius crinis-equi]
NCADRTFRLEAVVSAAYCVERFPRYIKDASRLRSIESRMDEGSVSEIDESLSVFPWTTLRSLNPSYDAKVTPVSVFNAFRLVLNLQSLVYRCDVSDYELSFEPFVPVISNFSTLSFLIGNKEGFHALLCDFFRGVTLPSLDTLKIRFIEPKHVRRIPLSDSGVISTLKLTPSVHTFTLSELWASVPRDYTEEPPKTLHKTVTDTLLQGLKAPIFDSNVFSAQTPLLPKLGSFKLAVQSHFDADQAFVEMVKSRWIGDTCSEKLRTAVLHVVNRKLVEGVYEPPKRLDEEGVMVTVCGNGIRVV